MQTNQSAVVLTQSDRASRTREREPKRQNIKQTTANKQTNRRARGFDFANYLTDEEFVEFLSQRHLRHSTSSDAAGCTLRRKAGDNKLSFCRRALKDANALQWRPTRCSGASACGSRHAITSGCCAMEWQILFALPQQYCTRFRNYKQSHILILFI